MRIDLHHHFSPRPYRERLLRYPIGTSIPEWSMAATESAMSTYAVDAAVLSAAAGVYFGDQGEATELARLVNDSAATIVQSDVRRFGALASLPLPDVDAALGELKYALDDLHLDGVTLQTSVNGTYIGAEEFAPVFDELERRRAYVFVHPSVPAWLPPYSYPPWVLEPPFESTRAALDLVYSGTLERCPSIRLQLSHLGGATPVLSHRIASLAMREPSRGHRLSEAPLAYLRRFFLDTALALSPPAFAATLALTGPDRLVFGTDWPYLPEKALHFDAPALGVSDAQITDIESGNSAKLVPRLAPQRR